MPLNIDISASQEEIFKKYLQIVNGVLSEKARLTPIEIDVLEKFLLIDYIYRQHPKEKRDRILFNKITKDKIRSEVYNISEASMNNVLMKLRRKGFLTKNSLKVNVPILDGKIVFNFKLEIK